jgi:hypothetical protein
MLAPEYRTPEQIDKQLSGKPALTCIAQPPAFLQASRREKELSFQKRPGAGLHPYYTLNNLAVR